MSATITVHHLELSRSTRVIWALEELGLTYELKTYRRHPKTFRAGPEIKAIHPAGRFPVVSIDQLVLAESGAILEHLAELYGALAPTEPAERLLYRYWMHFAEGSLMPPLLVAVITERLRKGVPFPVSLITGVIGRTIDAQYTRPQLADMMVMVEGHLAGHEYFAGAAFSMADVQMIMPVMAVLSQEARAQERYPAVHAWAERMRARPAFGKAVSVGGPLLPE